MSVSISIDTVFIDDISTQILSVEDDELGETDCLCCVIPGNPGVVRVYSQYIRQLHKRMKEDSRCLRYNLTGIGYAGHHVNEDHLPLDTEIYTLEQQLMHKFHVICHLVTSRAKRKLVLLGHSIGSWLILSLIPLIRERYSPQELEVVCVGCLMPTIRHLHRGMSYFVRVAFQPFIRSVVASLVHFLPMFVKDVLVNFATSSNNEARLAVRSSSYHSVMNVLSLAHQESVQVVDLTPSLLQTLRQLVGADALFMIYSPVDPYVPIEFYHDIRADLPNLDKIVMMDSHVKHAFVIENSVEVANQSHDFIVGWVGRRA